jgi:predicted MFS family arabinose efflux permease
MGVLVAIGALISYRWATTFPTLLAVRVIHGIGFVMFVTAMNASLVSFIPVARSAEAFGLISVNMLLPMAVVPALLDWLNLGPAHFVNILMVTAALMIPTALLPLLVLAGRDSAGMTIDRRKGDVLREIVTDFSDPRVPVLIATNFLAFLAYTPVFFFLKEYAEGKGIGSPGTFFSVATGAMIVIRLLGGRFFDRLNKARMLVASLLLLSLGYALLVFAAPGVFLLLALVLGVGWSLLMPFLNALLFDCSRPSARALNLNLSMVVLQLGYFVGPVIGAFVLRSFGYAGVFLYCGSMTFVGVGLNLAFLKSYAKQPVTAGAP